MNTEYYKNCTKCGRPQTICKGECCNKPKKACIKPCKPGCPNDAVIPTVTVNSIEDIKGLQNCFVHVTDINTTYYIDDKNNIITTWSGLASVPGYDFEANPLNLRNQVAYDADSNTGALYDKQGNSLIIQTSSIDNNYELLNNKPSINGNELSGNMTSDSLGLQDKLTPGDGIEIASGVISVSEPAPDGFFSGDDTVSQNGKTLSFAGVADAQLKTFELYGDTDGTDVVTGRQIIEFSDGSDSRVYEINLGKNLFDKNNFTEKYRYYIGGGGHYRQTQSTTPGANDYVAVISIEPNTTYTVSKDVQSTYNRLRVGICDAEPEINTAFPIWGGGDDAAEVTLTSGDNSRYMYIYYAGNDINEQLALNSLQVEKNSEKTSYAEYFSPITLESDEDVIFKDGDAWKVTKNSVTSVIDNDALVSQLNEISQNRMYEPNTSVSVSANGGLPAPILITAYNDNWDGVISGIRNSIATDDDLGLVKVGDGLKIDSDGTLSVSDENENDIPEYFDAQISSAVASINNNMNSVGRGGDTFVFITDIHWERNAKHSPALIKRILEDTNVKYVINGGDNYTNYTAKNAAMNELKTAQDVFQNFSDGNMLNVIGNHDGNIVGNEDYQERWLTSSEIYNNVFKRQEQLISEWNDDPVDESNILSQFYYYFDNTATKTRYVMLATALSVMGADQLSWLSDLLTNSDGWNVIIFAHWINYGSSASPTDGYTVDGTALKNLCDNHTDKVKAIISGHIHFDFEDHTSGGIPIIFTTTDATRESQYSTESIKLGTVSEQAFDVITIDYSTGTVKCVRIGRGQDRTILSTVGA